MPSIDLNIMQVVIYISLLTSFLILAFKGVTKWYLTHYSSLVIILFKWIYVDLYFLPVLLNTSFSSFCAFCVFSFESDVLNQDLKTYVLSLVNSVLVLLCDFVLFIKITKLYIKI